MPFVIMALKMIVARYAVPCIGLVCLFIGGVVGITFALDGWQAFFASIGFLLVAFVATAYFVVKMIKSFIKQQQESMQNLFTNMMGGEGAPSVNDGLNATELMSFVTQMSAGMNSSSLVEPNKIESSNTVDIKAVELDSAGNPIVSEKSDESPFMMHMPLARPQSEWAKGSTLWATNRNEMSDEDVIKAIKSEMSEEDFNSFEILSPEDKKEVIDSFREDGGDFLSADMPEEMFKEMSPEQQKQAQEMMNQMMGMFGSLFGGMDNLPETDSHKNNNENLVKNLEANMLLAANSNVTTVVEDAVVVTTHEKVEVLVANIVEDTSTLKSIDNSNVPNIVKSSGEHVEFDLEKMQKMLAGNVSEKK